jgi:hypothetical protein
MDVYLVPAGANCFGLYCESTADQAPPNLERDGGMWKQLQRKFGAVLAAVEREQDESSTPPVPPVASAGLFSRLRARALRWIAERVAEQRLLWRLRGQTEVRAFFPSGMEAAAALRTIRDSLERDARRHFRWLALDAVGGLFSLLLVPLPGPNLLGYYFAFRLVGHLLAIRGARQGLTSVSWDLQPSALLAELRGLERLPADERASRVRAIAADLGLPRLARFFERTTAEIA